MSKAVIEKLLRREDLSQAEASGLMAQIMAGELTDVQIAGTLIALRAKGPTVSEIAGFAETMRAKAVHVKPRQKTGMVDTCGTGGDGAQTFNISTAAALVVAGAGVPVAKHGNRAISSKCGSSDVLEALGVAMVGADRVAEVIDRVGIGFMFAPAHHPATKHAVTARRELGVRTIFNLLGPMTNPALVEQQVMGIYDPDLTATAADVLRSLGSKRAYVVHGLDGSDEVSLVANTKVAALRDGKISEFVFDPTSVGLEKVDASAIAGSTPDENAGMIRAILDGKKGPRRDAVVLNAAFALDVAGKVDSIPDGLRLAAETIDGGHARRVLDELVAVTGEIANAS